MPTLTQTPSDYAALAMSCLRPPQAMGLWDWCGANLVMPDGRRWDPRRAGLMRYWYRRVEARLSLTPNPNDPFAHRAEQIYLIVAAQLAKTTLAHATILSTIENHPRIIALFRARKDDLTNDRERKLRRQLEHTASLERMLPRGTEARERALSPRAWTVGSSLVYYRCGSVADDWRADAIDLLIPDEFDTYPADVEGYGDPIDQGLARQRTFRKSRLLLGITTPGVISGHGWRRLCSGSHERLLIDCPDCGGAQDLDPRQICLTEGRQLADVSAAEITAQHLGRFACRHCGSTWNASQLHTAVRTAIDSERPWCPGTWEHDDQHPQGRWKPHANLDSNGRIQSIPPSESTILSGQANSLYSLDETLDSFTARMALAAQGSPSQQKTFTNNERAEPYQLSIVDVDTDDISALAQPAKPYQIGAFDQPADWLLLHFDQQGNTREHYWFPWVLRAGVFGGESWLVDCGKARNASERDALEHRTWLINGHQREADLVTCDSANGNFLFDAYLWAAGDTSRRRLLRGDPRLPDGVPWLEVVDDPKKRRKTPKPSGVREWRISPHYWRDQFWDRLRGTSAPRVWMPSDAPDYYKASLTSEERVMETRRIAGGFRQVCVWRPRVITSTADRTTYRDDNHWWDCEASLAALINILGHDKPPVDLDPVPATPAPGFMDGYG